MVLKQQQYIVDSLNHNIAVLRQHIARTRQTTTHPDVDRLEDVVQNLIVRWENVCSQVGDRLKTAEEALQTQMVYRSAYENEIAWLNRVENTINSLRKPEEMQPEQYQSQLDVLLAEYAQLQDRTEAIENVNREGGKYIRQAKSYDADLVQYLENIVEIHGPRIRDQFCRTKPQPKSGAQIVTEELEGLNRRLAQLSSFILEKRNHMQVLIQNWKRQKQEEEERRRVEEEEKLRQFEKERLKKLEEADRIRRAREEAERKRLAEEEARRQRKQEELDRLRREEEERQRRKALEDAERLKREEERRRKQEEEDKLNELRRKAEEEERRRKAEDEERRRKAEEDERKRKAEEERRRKGEETRKKIEEEEKQKEAERRREQQKRFPETNMAQIGCTATPEGSYTVFEEPEEIPITPKIREHEEEPQMFQEETVIKKQFYEMEGILHKQTGEILTFVEAVRQGLLDLHSGGGEFYDIVSGRISLEKAVELGYIDGKLPEVLNRHYGIHHPDTKESLSLLDAIQHGLYDSDTRQLRDIHSGEILSMQECIEKGILTVQTQYWLVRANILKLPPISLEEAICRGVVDRETGDFTGRYTGEKVPLKEALYYGYVQIGGFRPAQNFAISLSDCIYLGLINAVTGEFHDRNSGEKFSLQEAVSAKKSFSQLAYKRNY